MRWHSSRTDLRLSLCVTDTGNPERATLTMNRPPGHRRDGISFPKTSPVAAKIAAAFQRLPRSLSKSQRLPKDFPGRCQNHSGFPKTLEALVENEKKCLSLDGFVVNRRPARCEVIDSKSWVLRSWGCVKSCFPPKKAY